MLRGLLKLTWLEIKIFLREPLGVIGTFAVPIGIFLFLARLGGGGSRPAPRVPGFMGADLPIFASLMVSLGAVMSLVTIVAIYREGGILKRLRATPLRPHTILTAHVLVKLLTTVVTIIALMLAGRRYVAEGADIPYFAFSLAVVFSTLAILSTGFIVASLVPTARFAQPVSALVFYPMLVLSGLFFPIDSLPQPLRAVTRLLPVGYAVSLMKGTWHGLSWSTLTIDVGMLALVFVVCISLSSRIFRWE
jgi:ABC-2 type transport system permease protein